MHRSNIFIEFRSTVIHALYKVTLSKDLTGLPPTPTDKLCHYLCCFLLLKCQHSPTTIYVSLLPHKPLSPLNGQGVESNCIHQKTCIYWKPSEVAQGELFLPGINTGCDKSTLTKWGAVSTRVTNHHKQQGPPDVRDSQTVTGPQLGKGQEGRGGNL